MNDGEQVNRAALNTPYHGNRSGQTTEYPIPAEFSTRSPGTPRKMIS